MLESKNCKKGEEQFEIYDSRTTGKTCLQYDYRDGLGQLHSTVVRLPDTGDWEADKNTAIAEARRKTGCPKI